MITKKKLEHPDRSFHNLRASRSGDRRYFMQFWSSKEPVGIIRSYYRATIYTKDRIYPLWCDPEFESNENFFFSGNIKITAVLQDNNSGLLTFPDFGGVSIDQERAETFGLMTVSQDDDRHLECEFRHLSLAEYLTALHVHVSGDSLKGQELEKKSQHKSYVFNPFFFLFCCRQGFPVIGRSWFSSICPGSPLPARARTRWWSRTSSRAWAPPPRERTQSTISSTSRRWRGSGTTSKVCCDGHWILFLRM